MGGAGESVYRGGYDLGVWQAREEGEVGVQVLLRLSVAGQGDGHVRSVRGLSVLR